MIVDGIVTVLAGLLSFVGGLFGSIPVPGFIDSIDSGLVEVSGYAGGMGHLIPFGDAVSAATFVIGCMAVGFGIKVVRIVLSLFTAGGGSAG
jgi:hypothetical protein